MEAYLTSETHFALSVFLLSVPRLLTVTSKTKNADYTILTDTDISVLATPG